MTLIQTRSLRPITPLHREEEEEEESIQEGHGASSGVWWAHKGSNLGPLSCEASARS